ncbi:TPA: hypothetical protein ENX78_17455 [Candidatus Poribacteria bacterium]|nr:hypothetical protein [Candidatus Poribacteria bacterium]
MSSNFYFDFRDVFRAGRMGFKGKKIFTHLLGFLLGYGIYEILVYLSLSGSNIIGDFWKTYGLLPVFIFTWKSSIILPTATIIVMAISALIWFLIYLLFSTAVSKIAIEELRGDDFYPLKSALKFAFKYSKILYLTILGLIGIIIFCIFWPSLVGLLDLIPKIEQFAEHFGTPLTAFLTIPVYFLSILMILTIFACIFGIFLIPSIIAVTEEDTFETIYQLYSTIWNQPWRLVIYNKLLWFIAILGFTIFAYISIAGLYLAFLPSALLAHQESYYFADVIARSLKIIGAGGFAHLIPGANITDISMPWTLDLATFFMFVSFIIIVGIVVSYPMAIFSCGSTIIYAILRKKIDNENMLESKQEEKSEEKKPGEQKPEEQKSDT